MKRTIKNISVFLAAGALLYLAACRKSNQYSNYQPVTKHNSTVLDYLALQDGNFDSVLFVLDRSGISTILKTENVTFFAPSDQSLMAAMNGYNIARKARGLQEVYLKDIDSTSWRAIMGRYIVPGKFTISSFEEQDGKQMSTVVSRYMHGKVQQKTASGVTGGGTNTIRFAHMNGSRFERDWLFANVTTPDIQLNNGVIHILEPRHLVGFNYFAEKAGAVQNLYSEERSYVSGSLILPNTDSRIWTLRVKKLTAIGPDSLETEGADLLATGVKIRMAIHDNDSITVIPAPGSTIQAIENNGPCFYDPATFSFTLNYRYTTAEGKFQVSETYKYIAL